MKWEDYDKHEDGILLDEKTGLKFGPEKQLTVMGYYSLPSSAKKTRYIIHCRICSDDSELFGDGLFDMQWGNLKIGNMPCGCSVAPKWSQDQMRIRASRKCEDKGYTFLSWAGEYKANRTGINILNEFGQKDYIGLAALLTNQNSSMNRKRMISLAKSKPDAEIIQSFINTKAFHPQTKFWKSERVDKNGQRIYWWVECGECGGLSESYRSNIQKGKRSCKCVRQVGQNYMYINMIYDANLPLGIKFGKTNLPIRRLKEQQIKSYYNIESFGIWYFEAGVNSTTAERLCKQSFNCGVIPYEMMRDGWSETTYVYNLEKVIKIYEQNGGIKQ